MLLLSWNGGCICVHTRLKSITDEVSQGVQRVLGDRLHSIILYGSYAHGDCDDESDVDIMVLADIEDEEMSKLEHEIDIISGDVSLKNGVTVCVMLYDKSIFEMRMPISPFYRNVINNGVPLY